MPFLSSLIASIIVFKNIIKIRIKKIEYNNTANLCLINKNTNVKTEYNAVKNIKLIENKSFISNDEFKNIEYE
ncbi:hypothetical protein CHRYSEO8AT_300037 [Chryseobacterium sp. 8AT]|nr:hypothetical protein CHRYSEO8AT_300037 [Chryseobacterium sp. 8AT]